MMGIRRSQCSTDRSNPWGIWLVMLCAWIGTTDLWEQYPMSIACGFDMPVVFGGCTGTITQCPFVVVVLFGFWGLSADRRALRRWTWILSGTMLLCVWSVLPLLVLLCPFGLYLWFCLCFCNVFPGVLLAFLLAYIRHVFHDSMGSPK